MERLPRGGSRLRIPVSPAKGELLLVRSEQSLAGPALLSREAYLIPTPQGEAILGTTVEFVGYDKRSTISGGQSILLAVSEIVPSIGCATPFRTWAGLRPATPDKLPLSGRHPALDGLIAATGHYRSGILLGPLNGPHDP